jgi:hypothetical protein
MACWEGGGSSSRRTDLGSLKLISFSRERERKERDFCFVLFFVYFYEGNIKMCVTCRSLRLNATRIYWLVWRRRGGKGKVVVCVCVDIRNTAQERENKKRASRYCRAWDIQFAGGCIYCSPNSLICTHHTHNWVWSPVNTQTHTHTHTHSTHSVSSLLGVDLISSALFIYYLYIFALSFVIFSVLPYPYIHQTHTHRRITQTKKTKQKNPQKYGAGDGGVHRAHGMVPSFPTPSIYTTQCCCIYILSYRIHLSIRERARPLMGRLDMYRVAANFSIRSRRRRMKWTFYLFWASPGLIFGCSKKWDEGRDWWGKKNKNKK